MTLDPKGLEAAAKAMCKTSGLSAWQNNLPYAEAAITAYNAAPASPPAQDSALREALERIVKMRKGICEDVRSAHQNRGNGASEWMREDDRDFRAELTAAFDQADAALQAPSTELADAKAARALQEQSR